MRLLEEHVAWVWLRWVKFVTRIVQESLQQMPPPFPSQSPTLLPKPSYFGLGAVQSYSLNFFFESTIFLEISSL